MEDESIQEGQLGVFLLTCITFFFAEIGDKTQLLSFALAARYRKRSAIILAIFVATLVNHALAGSLGVLIAHWLSPRATALLVGVGFLAFGAWALVPDKLDEAPKTHGGVFMTTLIAFFIAEMGDKTQLATIGLGARFASPVAVVLGTTIGMMIANVPAVFVGHELLKYVPLNIVRMIAAVLFLVIGLWVIAQTAGWTAGLI